MAEQTRTDRVRGLLRNAPDGLAIMGMAATLGEDRKNVEYVVQGMAKRGEVVRTGVGTYRMATAQERETASRLRHRAQRAAENGEPAAAAVVPAASPALTHVGRMTDGRVLLEDRDGTLWVATPVTGGFPR